MYSKRLQHTSGIQIIIHRHTAVVREQNNRTFENLVRVVDTRLLSESASVNRTFQSVNSLGYIYDIYIRIVRNACEVVLYKRTVL